MTRRSTRWTGSPSRSCRGCCSRVWIPHGPRLTKPSRGPGQIWWVDVGLDETSGSCVSNNVRNRKLRDIVMVRLTTADEPDIPSILEFGAGEISDTRCFVVAEDVWMIGKEWLRDRVGALSPSQMERVKQALRVGLDP